MRDPILSKAQMYGLLKAGMLGNTILSYSTIDQWKASDEYERYEVWGVRSETPGGPCRLYCPRDEVEDTVRGFGSHKPNISIMIDACVRVTLWADVFVGDRGIAVYGIENPPRGGSWRKLMPSQGRTYEGLLAKCLLDEKLNAASRSDLYELLDEYPDHVIELSACDQNIGIFPHRNAVIWEVRVAFGRHGGEYERKTWRNPSSYRPIRPLDGD